MRARVYVSSTQSDLAEYRLAVAAALRQLGHEVVSMEANPANAQVLDIKGYALYRGRRYREAVVTLKRAVEESPESALAHLNLGLALFREGRRTEARAALDRALELRPSLADDAQYRRTMRSLGGG